MLAQTHSAYLNAKKKRKHFLSFITLFILSDSLLSPEVGTRFPRESRCSLPGSGGE
jgi:hypothetical protein